MMNEIQFFELLKPWKFLYYPTKSGLSWPVSTTSVKILNFQLISGRLTNFPDITGLTYNWQINLPMLIADWGSQIKFIIRLYIISWFFCHQMSIVMLVLQLPGPRQKFFRYLNCITLSQNQPWSDKSFSRTGYVREAALHSWPSYSRQKQKSRGPVYLNNSTRCEF